ncbi:MAG: hypothetical protein LBQ62_07805 [Candidatus Accumulibacter sp.]|jgi:hypothetical protein|nr:hypothetical protein [Accumulibacter sp.]
MRVRLQSLIPLLALMLALPLRAGPAENPGPVPQTPEQAEAQRRKADLMREEAQRRYAEDEAACQKKILVSACLDEARERHLKATIEARQLDIPARAFQREFRRGEVEAEKDRRAAERPAREARQRESAERYKAEEAAKTSEREQKQLKKERKARENREKLEKKKAKRKLEEEKRARKQAERIERKNKERAKVEKPPE